MHLIGWEQISQWKSLTKCLMKCPPCWSLLLRVLCLLPPTPCLGGCRWAKIVGTASGLKRNFFFERCTPSLGGCWCAVYSLMIPNSLVLEVRFVWNLSIPECCRAMVCIPGRELVWFTVIQGCDSVYPQCKLIFFFVGCHINMLIFNPMAESWAWCWFASPCKDVLLPPTPCLGGFVGCHLKRKESMRMVCILGYSIVWFGECMCWPISTTHGALLEAVM